MLTIYRVTDNSTEYCMFTMQLIRAIYVEISVWATDTATLKGSVPSVMMNCESFEFFVPLFAIATIPR